MHDGLCSGSAPPGAAALPPGARLGLSLLAAAPLGAGLCGNQGEDLGGDFRRPSDQPPKRYRNYLSPVRLG